MQTAAAAAAAAACGKLCWGERADVDVPALEAPADRAFNAPAVLNVVEASLARHRLLAKRRGGPSIDATFTRLGAFTRLIFVRVSFTTTVKETHIFSPEEKHVRVRRAFIRADTWCA